MGEQDLYERSKAEVEDLHRSLFEWCTGRVVGDNQPAWERIRSSWASGFRLADEQGLREGSEHLLELQVRFNESVEDPLQAQWLEAFTGYEVAEGLFQCSYEAWERRESGAEQGRAWSVLLRERGEGPGGLVWVHAHRSDLAEGAAPSFRPLEAQAAPPVREAEEEGEPLDAPRARVVELDPLWSAQDPPLEEPAAPPEELTPLTQIRAFFGDPAAQAEAGGAPPLFDQHDPEMWLRTLRVGGPEAVLRAGLVVLDHLVQAWEGFFPEELGPGQILAALQRYQEGEPAALQEARALAEELGDLAAAAREFEPEGELPPGYREYVRLMNAAEAAGRLAAGAGGSALALGVKLSPVLAGLTQETRLALRPQVLAAFSARG